MVLDYYQPKEWRRTLHFERIKPKHRVFINGFQTYQEELEQFLKQDAIKAQKLTISNTFLIFDKKDHKRYKKAKEKICLLGYVTILNDSIRLDETLKETFLEKGISYKTLPAMKIGRLCVDTNYLRRGIGKCILIWAMYRVAVLNQVSACRFITLDAKRHEDRSKDSLPFYEKYGFIVMKKKKTGTIPMYRDIHGIVEKYIKRDAKNNT